LSIKENGFFVWIEPTGSLARNISMIIDKMYRGSGVGKQLMQMAEKYAAENGCVSVELITANHRRKDDAHAFYEKRGYQDHLERDYTYFSKEEEVGRSRFKSLNS
jgi:GNAT superfamily N-acetyltransferase